MQETYHSDMNCKNYEKTVQREDNPKSFPECHLTDSAKILWQIKP
jgi:hypothetical protein